MANLQELQDLLNKAVTEIPKKAAAIIGVEGKNFINKNFQDQGFTDTSLKKWDPRKTTDRKGRDITRYRTDRVGSKGDFTQFGRQNEGRAILTGHETGGDKLRNSWRYTTINAQNENIAVKFFTYKNYASYHNEGTDDLPKRQFIGKSAYLDGKIQGKLKRTLDQLFK